MKTQFESAILKASIMRTVRGVRYFWGSKMSKISKMLTFQSKLGLKLRFWKQVLCRPSGGRVILGGPKWVKLAKYWLFSQNSVWNCDFESNYNAARLGARYFGGSKMSEFSKMLTFQSKVDLKCWVFTQNLAWKCIFERKGFLLFSVISVFCFVLTMICTIFSLILVLPLISAISLIPDVFRHLV